MKKFTVALIAAVFSTMLLFPALSARAQDWEDMNHDAQVLHHQRHALRHDYRELNDAVRRGDYGEAAHEQAEIAQRRYNMERRQRDLNEDYYNRYNNPYYSPYYDPY
jgi:hypothetical protein